MLKNMFVKSGGNLKLFALGTLNVRNNPFMLLSTIRIMVDDVEIGSRKLFEVLGWILDCSGRGDQLERRCTALVLE